MADAEISATAVIAAAKARTTTMRPWGVGAGGRNPPPAQNVETQRIWHVYAAQKALHITFTHAWNGTTIRLCDAYTLRSGKYLPATAPTVQAAQSRIT